MRRRLALALVSLLPLAAACSGGGDPAEPSATPPAEVLAAAKASLAQAKTVKLVLTSSDVPSGRDGVSAATGSGVISATEPKFAGKVTATAKGLSGAVDVIAIGPDTWWKFFTPDFTKVDLATLGAPNPAELFNAETGVGSILTETKDPKAGGQRREGKDVVTTYSGAVPASTMQRLLKLGKGAPDFEATYGITDAGQLRTATLKGEFYSGATSTYRLVLSDFGAAVDITRP